MWLKETINKKYKKGILFDEAGKAPHKFGKVDFYVLERGGEKKLVTKVSGIINNLQKIEEFRIYAEKNLRDEVYKFCNDFWLQKINI